MDTFDDVFLPRPAGQVGCGRFELDDVFLGACFGAQLQYCDGGVGGGGGDVSSSFGGAAGAPGLANDTVGVLSSGVDVFASVLGGGAAGAHDGLLGTALAFSRALVEGGGRGGGSNGAMLSSYSGTTTGGNISSGESNNYSGGGHDAEVASSPTSTTVSPTTPSPQALHPEQKLTDGYPTIATAQPAPATALPRPGAKRKAAAVTATATSISFGQGAHDATTGAAAGGYEPDMEAMAQVKEMIYRAAAMRPVNLNAEAVADKPRRKNVRISSDPQTVAARLRRERVSERLRVLQKLVPGGSKMDTASMLDEAASYLKFLRSQVQALETLGSSSGSTTAGASTGRLHQHRYSNNTGSLGFARNNSNISSYANPNGNATKLL